VSAVRRTFQPVVPIFRSWAVCGDGLHSNSSHLKRCNHLPEGTSGQLISHIPYMRPGMCGTVLVGRGVVAVTWFLLMALSKHDVRESVDLGHLGPPITMITEGLSPPE
jgi:hypothetical protein